MWQYDFNLFFEAGQAVLKGLSPYTIYDFNPPYLLAMLFATVAWLPKMWVYAAYVAACIGLIWKIRKWQSIWVLLSFPVFFNLFVGQVDLLLALIAILAGPYALPLLLVKPQLAFVLAPWIIRHITRKELKIVALVSLAFVTLSFLIRPTWLQEWLHILPSVSQYARRDANLYWLVPTQFKSIAVVIGCLIALPLGFYLKDRRLSWNVLHLFAPLTNIYSASALLEWIGPIEFILSWLAILYVGDIHSGAPLFVVAVSILIRFSIHNRRQTLQNQSAVDSVHNLSAITSKVSHND
jgi:hypothetical protein